MRLRPPRRALDAARGPEQPAGWFALFALLAAGVLFGPIALRWSREGSLEQRRLRHRDLPRTCTHKIAIGESGRIKVRFGARCGHKPGIVSCPLSATSRLMQCSKKHCPSIIPSSPPSSAALRSMRFHLDIGSLDDRPPLLDLGLLVGGERGWCLLLAGRDHQPEIGQAFAHVCIG